MVTFSVNRSLWLPRVTKVWLIIMTIIMTKGQPLNAAFMKKDMFTENQSHAREDNEDATYVS